MHTTPVSLLERLREPSDHQAWERFAELYTPLLYFWARRAGLAEPDAADVVQNVFVILLQKLPEFTYDRQQSFRGWMRTITLNLWRNHLRKESRLPSAGLDFQAPSSEDGVAELEAAEYRQYLAARALELMQTEFEPTTWRACWEHVVLGRSAADIAADLGVREGTVYSAKSRVLRRLRDELNGLWD